MADIEAQREANLRSKERLLAELDLNSGTIGPMKAQTTKRDTRSPTKRRKMTAVEVPIRSSARIQSAGSRPSYKEEKESLRGLTSKKSKDKLPRNRPAPLKVVEAREVSYQPVTEVETIRRNWSPWIPEGAASTRDEEGSFHFEDYPLFLPNKSPEEMIREGCFGGSYWRPLKSRRLGIVIEDDWKELPAEWIAGLDVHIYLTNPEYNADINKYKVACGQSIEEWEASGWIMHEFDVRGWFQWYCRFFQGRRSADDDRQVSRWRKCVGPTGRWKRMLLKAYLKQSVHHVFDDGEDEEAKEVSPVMHQTCHHWAYEIKQHDLDEAWQSPG